MSDVVPSSCSVDIIGPIQQRIAKNSTLPYYTHPIGIYAYYVHCRLNNIYSSEELFQNISRSFINVDLDKNVTTKVANLKLSIDMLITNHYYRYLDNLIEDKQIYDFATFQEVMLTMSPISFHLGNLGQNTKYRFMNKQ